MTNWTDEEIAELEDPESWDWETATAGGPTPDVQASLQVSFSAQELQRIEACAQAMGLPVLEWIRVIVLGHVTALESVESRARRGAA